MIFILSMFQVLYCIELLGLQVQVNGGAQYRKYEVKGGRGEEGQEFCHLYAGGGSALIVYTTIIMRPVSSRSARPRCGGRAYAPPARNLPNACNPWDDFLFVPCHTHVKSINILALWHVSSPLCRVEAVLQLKADTEAAAAVIRGSNERRAAEKAREEVDHEAEKEQLTAKGLNPYKVSTRHTDYHRRERRRGGGERGERNMLNFWNALRPSVVNSNDDLRDVLAEDQP